MRDVGVAGAGQPEDLALPRGQRVVARGHGARGQLGVQVAATGVDLADRGGQLLGRGVLGDEAAHPGGHGAAQVPRAAEAGEDAHRAAGPGGAQLLGDGEAVGAGHVDVEHRDIGVERGDGAG